MDYDNQSELIASLERSKNRGNTLARKLKSLTESYTNQEKEDARTIRKLGLASRKLEKRCMELDSNNKELNKGLATAHRRIDELVEKILNVNGTTIRENILED
jgi:chromosome segregation ATPase